MTQNYQMRVERYAKPDGMVETVQFAAIKYSFGLMKKY